MSLQGITQVIRQSAAFEALLSQLRSDDAPRALGLPRAARPVVVSALHDLGRPMVYVTLTIDHRALDGFQANAFLARWVEAIEQWS